MTSLLTPDLCVIGAGSAGLSIASGAQQMGADTVLIEAAEMGGDCLNHGCVPSKALLSAARDGLGHTGARARVRDAIAAIAPHDSQERFEGLGVHVLRTHGRFANPREILAGDYRIRPRRAVVATGSRPAVPSIPGLDDSGYLTNETIFALDDLPEHLIVIGGGPVGCELAQAFRRLGARVSVVEALRILPKDDPTLVDLLRAKLQSEGIDIYEGASLTEVRREGNSIEAVLSGSGNGSARTLKGTHLLVAVGRAANLEGLGLEEAGIATENRAIRTDARLRTTNRRVHAAGDVVGGPQFTHAAEYHAGVVIKNVLFRIPAKIDYRAMPWVTYTDPELAHVGMPLAEAVDQGARILEHGFDHTDRAIVEERTMGMVRAAVDAKGRILGASILGAHAGELIQTWQLAIQNGLKIGAIAQSIPPYPTLGEASKRAAASFYTPRLYSDRTRALVRFLSRLG